jgi:uncharacterized 2Fe-2S/4Fe-4S cluster protein (DUF4445 family)
MMKSEPLKYYNIRILPYEKSIDVPENSTLLYALKNAGIEIQATCGGEGTCGDCMVQVISGNYEGKITDNGKYNPKGFVLACNTKIIDNMVILSKPPDALTVKDKIDIFEIDKNNISCSDELKPEINVWNLTVPPPTLEDKYGDLKRLQRELLKVSGISFTDAEYLVIKKITGLLKNYEHAVSVYTFHNGHGKIIDCKPPLNTNGLFGLAVDIGTTTVALCLVNLSNGRILFNKTILNLQRSCGEDIISRINYAGKNDGLSELNRQVLTTINSLIEEALKLNNVKNEEIYYAVIAGNTTMIHLFLGLDPAYIRESPYVPVFNKVPFLKASDTGLNMNPEGRVYCSPSVGSYVGGDITSGIISTPLLKNNEKINLFIDIGTNGEMVIGNNEWMITCACSAGPAFEGSGITSGMPASRGAIEKVKINNKIPEYKVIGNKKPKGICGSGIVDLLAELFINGIVERSGKIRTSADPEHIIEWNNKPAYRLVKSENTADGKDIIITENDITNLIRTKGAIFSSCSLLIKNVGIDFSNIDNIYIAGGFGKHLDIENSIRIGLFPDVERSKFHYMGNTSLIGAYLTLINGSNRHLLEEIADKMTYLELNTEPNYMNEYTGSLFLPHTDMSLFPSLSGV